MVFPKIDEKIFCGQVCENFEILRMARHLYFGLWSWKKICWDEYLKKKSRTKELFLEKGGWAAPRGGDIFRNFFYVSSFPGWEIHFWRFCWNRFVTTRDIMGGMSNFVKIVRNYLIPWPRGCVLKIWSNFAGKFCPQLGPMVFPKIDEIFFCGRVCENFEIWRTARAFHFGLRFWKKICRDEFLKKSRKK